MPTLQDPTRPALRARVTPLYRRATLSFMSGTPERWLSVVGWETSHEVSDYGNVRSIDRWVIRRGQHKPFLVSGRITTQTKTDHGYYIVTLKCGGKKLRAYVHRLVLCAFVGPPPPGQEGLHGPAGSWNNRLANLRWGTRSENHLDKRRDGTDPMLNRTRCPRKHLLVQPNLVPSMLPGRSCLACERGRGVIRWRQPRNPNQTLSLQENSDKCYRSIMLSASITDI